MTELVPPAGGSPRVSAAQQQRLPTPPASPAAVPLAGRTGGQPEYDQVRGLPSGTPSEKLDPPIPPTNLRRGALAERTNLDPETATRAEVCAVACARAWEGDGEILASPFTPIPSIGARLARATTDPDLLLSDGEAGLVAGIWALGDPPPVIEGWLPFRAVFDICWAGRRHIMMVPSQIDRFGNANISAIGDFDRPARALLGMRGAPGNTVNHPTSYWVRRHGPRVFVPRVDVVCGIGYDSAAAAGPTAQRFLDLRRIVSDLAVLDFAGPDRSMRLVSTHPGVTVAQVVEATGFPLDIPAEVPTTPLPTPEELRLIREVIDPKGLREKEVRAS